jgi:hypothetical protein
MAKGHDMWIRSIWVMGQTSLSTEDRAVMVYINVGVLSSELNNSDFVIC